MRLKLWWESCSIFYWWKRRDIWGTHHLCTCSLNLPCRDSQCLECVMSFPFSCFCQCTFHPSRSSFFGIILLTLLYLSSVNEFSWSASHHAFDDFWVAFYDVVQCGPTCWELPIHSFDWSSFMPGSIRLPPMTKPDSKQYMVFREKRNGHDLCANKGWDDYVAWSQDVWTGL